MFYISYSFPMVADITYYAEITCRILNTSPYPLPTLFQLNCQQTHVVYLSLYRFNVRYAATPNSLVYFYVLYLFLLKIFTFALESWLFEVRYLKPINCNKVNVYFLCTVWQWLFTLAEASTCFQTHWEYRPMLCSTLWYKFTEKNSVALVRERTMPTERPPPVGEVSANFCG